MSSEGRKRDAKAGVKLGATREVYMCVIMYMMIIFDFSVFITMYISLIHVPPCPIATLMTYLHSYIREFICSYIHSFIHTYTHTCIHTYIHTNIRLLDISSD